MSKVPVGKRQTLPTASGAGCVPETVFAAAVPVRSLRRSLLLVSEWAGYSYFRDYSFLIFGDSPGSLVYCTPLFVAGAATDWTARLSAAHGNFGQTDSTWGDRSGSCISKPRSA